MKNYYGEDFSFVWWCIRSIISGTVATLCIVIFVWGFLIYEQEFSPQEVSNGFVRGVAAIIMLTPVLIGWHSFLYFISYYFLRHPKKLIDISQLLKGVVFLIGGYVISFIVLWGLPDFNLELFMTSIFLFMVISVPLILGFIIANIFKK
ncbi:hypothetical protein SDC64_12355 [Acinetobacter haemolyticus]|uniref:Uncharacterized protein n=1 Tax=Acinetobacter suaedae TaxID=2609668 RepID=A0A5P1UUZ3_9GAMM|nr:MULTISPECIES: hypothetical protein [Acinetobacter]QER40374.1 hypothetical protein F2A31_11945 [Acinetobacter sp. C16S1]WPO66704.1 hypothetical protein SDC64_12355 [Acinetobacter haemolyticus]